MLLAAVSAYLAQPIWNSETGSFEGSSSLAEQSMIESQIEATPNLDAKFIMGEVNNPQQTASSAQIALQFGVKYLQSLRMTDRLPDRLVVGMIEGSDVMKVNRSDINQIDRFLRTRGWWRRGKCSHFRKVPLVELHKSLDAIRQRELSGTPCILFSCQYSV